MSNTKASRPFRVGQWVRVRPGNLGAGTMFKVDWCGRGCAGGWFINGPGGVCWAANKLERCK